MNKDHFYRGTFTTYILHYYIQCSALQWIVICVSPGWRGGERGEGSREGGEEEDWLKIREVVRVLILLLLLFFLNHSTVCSIKVKPIER